ncbi:PAS-domain containing protein [Paracoccus albus]|uniref:PAS-domain containing protein n=1 Tax=Paracoccus albus TaxID=3017784 RepID=UPI0022F0480D|nr:PAS-domain containing protein [Paracoccus albus]WBU60048.1 PAS-domain containing protein [Paracoccus albus]
MIPHVSIWLVLAGGALFALLIALCIRYVERSKRSELLEGGLVEPCVFLYREDRLIDATAPARRILDGCSGDDLPALKIWLAERFSDLQKLEEVAQFGGDATLTGKTASDAIEIRLQAEETLDGALRLTLILPQSGSAGMVVDALSQQAMEEELSQLRGIVESAPIPITRRGRDGEIVWANSTYLEAALQADPSAVPWPLPDILAGHSDAADADEHHRSTIQSGEAVHWFRCHKRSAPNGEITYALPIDSEVQAERNLRDFLQTLTKTFADIPIGLAIFDEERRLQLFNPALIDLTGLPAAFLTARPSLYSMLDQMRELRMVPEPRDYRSWRKQMTTLESAASAGLHVETWTLPGGRTYRVTGRPHPNGAVAFLMEDMTSEVTLTRKFRAELTLGAQVLDGIEQGLIVFNAVGQVVMTNAAYTSLWGEPPERMPDALQVWQGDWQEAPGLDELRLSLTSEDLQQKARGVMFGPDGQGAVAWSVTALRGGKRMVRFTKQESTQRVDQPPRELAAKESDSVQWQDDRWA